MTEYKKIIDQLSDSDSKDTKLKNLVLEGFKQRIQVNRNF